MVKRIFFDRAEDAEAISVNIGEPVGQGQSIEVDPEELAVSLRQVNIKSTSYTIAEIEQAVEPEQ